jgi:hypothetical protein
MRMPSRREWTLAQGMSGMLGSGHARCRAGITSLRRQSYGKRNRRQHGRDRILVIVGIVLMLVWSFWVGLIVALVGLIAFGGFAKGKWY